MRYPFKEIHPGSGVQTYRSIYPGYETHPFIGMTINLSVFGNVGVVWWK